YRWECRRSMLGVQLGRGGSVVTSKTALWLSGAAALVFAPALADEPETIGTGFFANQEGLAVTNAHVVNECRRTTARFRGEIVEARVIAQDTQNDLALLGVDARPATSAVLSPHSPDEAVICYALTAIQIE